MLPAILAAVLLLAAVLVILNGRRQRKLGGLPGGALISGDNLCQDCPVLVSRRHGLKGKPDAVVRMPSGDVIPIERKKNIAPQRGPYESDLIQAAAYCVLVEEHYRRVPPFMRIQYADRCFDEPYTLQRKQWVLATCARLRKARQSEDVHRSHRTAAKWQKLRAAGQLRAIVVTRQSGRKSSRASTFARAFRQHPAQ